MIALPLYEVSAKRLMFARVDCVDAIFAKKEAVLVFARPKTLRQWMVLSDIRNEGAASEVYGGPL